MKKFKPIWYDQDSVIKEDTPIIAESKDEAMRKAYERYNGNGPAPLLSLIEIES